MHQISDSSGDEESSDSRLDVMEETEVMQQAVMKYITEELECLKSALLKQNLRQDMNHLRTQLDKHFKQELQVKYNVLERK